MNTTQTTKAPQPLLSTPSRLATAVAIAAVMALGSTAVEQASRQAVESAMTAFAPDAAYVTLPSVEIIGRRDPAALRPSRPKALS